MNTQLEDRLSSDLRAIAVTPPASSDFVNGVLGQAARRRRSEGFAQGGAMMMLALVLGVGVWMNLPASTPVVTASSPAGAQVEPVESPYSLSEAQQGLSSTVDVLSGGFVGLLLRMLFLSALLAAMTFFVGRFRRSTGRPVWRWQGVRAVFFTLVMLIASFTWAFDVFYLPSGSMEPTFASGTRMLVTNDTDVEIGDLVIARVSDPNRPTVIPQSVRRVVGLGGDELHGVDGELLINGHRLENWVGHSDGRLQDFGPVIVPDGEVFFIGDNVTGSLDSRELGTRPADVIEGTILWATGSPVGLARPSN